MLTLPGFSGLSWTPNSLSADRLYAIRGNLDPVKAVINVILNDTKAREGSSLGLFYFAIPNTV
jgi:hypothetical protein